MNVCCCLCFAWSCCKHQAEGEIASALTRQAQHARVGHSRLNVLHKLPFLSSGAGSCVRHASTCLFAHSQADTRSHTFAQKV